MALSYTITSAPIRWITLDEKMNIKNLDLYGQELEDESQLQRPLGFIKFFTDIDECVDYMTDVQDSFIVLTIPDRLAWHVIPHIHDVFLLAAVYIICQPENDERNKKWSANYSKVKAVISRTEDYLITIYRNHFSSPASKKKPASSIDSSHTRFNGTTPFNLFNATENTYKDLSIENGNFVWMQLLIDVLLNLDTSKSLIDEFIQMCHAFDKDEINEEQIFLFAGVYDSFNPIKWYTKEPFVYRFLNQICRSEDIDKLILLRILVRDMNNQLKEEQKDLWNHLSPSIEDKQ